MTLNGMKIEGKNVSISNNDKTTMNQTADGNVHGYFWGSHKEITFDVEWLSADDRQELEESRKTKILLVLDTGEEYNVRIVLSGFQEIWIQGVPVYNVGVTATEVLT
jgi:hypothetical protein